MRSTRPQFLPAPLSHANYTALLMRLLMDVSERFTLFAPEWKWARHNDDTPSMKLVWTAGENVCELVGVATDMVHLELVVPHHLEPETDSDTCEWLVEYNRFGVDRYSADISMCRKVRNVSYWTSLSLDDPLLQDCPGNNHNLPTVVDSIIEEVKVLLNWSVA